MQISKWGNSLAVRLPATLVKEINLSVGDEVELRVDVDRTFYLKRTMAMEDHFSRLRKFRGIMPEDFPFDREEANAR